MSKDFVIFNIRVLITRLMFGIKPILLISLLTLTISKITIDQVQDKLKEIAESPVVNLIFFFDSLKSRSLFIQ